MCQGGLLLHTIPFGSYFIRKIDYPLEGYDIMGQCLNFHIPITCQKEEIMLCLKQKREFGVNISVALLS